MNPWELLSLITGWVFVVIIVCIALVIASTIIGLLIGAVVTLAKKRRKPRG